MTDKELAVMRNRPIKELPPMSIRKFAFVFGMSRESIRAALAAGAPQRPDGLIDPAAFVTWQAERDRPLVDRLLRALSADGREQ